MTRTLTRRALAVLLAAVLAVGYALAVPTPARAGTVTVTPTVDTFVNKNAPTSSFGADTIMRLDDGYPKVAMVKFDAPVPAGDTITSATLRLTATADSDPVQFRVHEYPVSSWDGSVTWDTAPSWGPRIDFGQVNPGGTLDVDVTSAVTAGEPVAFALVRSSTGSDTKLHTSENATGGPELIVVSEAGDPPPAPQPHPTDERLVDALAAVQAAERHLQASPAEPTAAQVDVQEALDLLNDYLGTPDPNTNEAPVVNAGPNAVTSTGSATLNGSAADDGLPTGSTLTYGWSQVSGPGTATFSSPAALSTGVSLPTEGVYVLRLSVSDGDFTVTDDVSVEYETGTPPPPDNAAPTVNAGPDRTVELSETLALTASASDDGLPSGSSLTAAWSYSGPGTVTFTDPAALSTSATFSAVGSYVLTVTVSDSAQTGSDSLTVNVVDDPATEPTPPPAAGTEFAFGADSAYLESLPTTGAEWNRVKAMADEVYDLKIGDGATDGSGSAFAGGLVYQATGDTAYKTKVNAALDAVEATNPADWWHAAANRKLIGWALAGQLVDRDVRDAGGSLTSWGSWLNTHLTVTHDHGPGRAAVMADTAAGWDNNHGSAARASEAAIRAVLGLSLTNQCDYAKAWLGGAHSGHGFVDSTKPGPGAMGITDPTYSRTWQHDPARPSGVVPSSAWAGEPVDPAKAGAIPSDVFRDGGAFPNPGSSTHYIFGNGHRMTNALTVLAANGCVLWDYADQAAKRWRVWAVDNGVTPSASQHQHGDAILDAVYGTSFGTVGTTGGEGIVGTDWLTLGGAFPAR